MTILATAPNKLPMPLRHLVNLVHDLTGRGVGLKVLVGQGANLDTTTANGRLVFGIFAALAEFERELIVEHTHAGLASARAWGRDGERPLKMTAAKLRLARAAMGQPGTKVGELCAELGVTRQTLYRHVTPIGKLRPDGLSVLGRKKLPGAFPQPQPRKELTHVAAEHHRTDRRHDLGKLSRIPPDQQSSDLVLRFSDAHSKFYGAGDRDV